MKKISLIVWCCLFLINGQAQNKPLEFVYKQVDTTALKMQVYYPQDYVKGEKRSTILLFFGGGWNTGSVNQFKHQALHFAAKGMIAVTADYRVKSRQHTSPFECVKDGRSAMRYLRTHADELGIDTGRIAAGGGSAGGHVAAATDLTRIDETTDDLTVSPRPNALVLFNPVFHNGPGNYGYDRLQDNYQKISPYHNIRKGAAPTLVFLGTRDKLIPVETAKEYQQKMREVGSRCELLLYEGQGHGFFNYKPKKDLTYYQQTLDEAVRFLTSLGYMGGD